MIDRARLGLGCVLLCLAAPARAEPAPRFAAAYDVRFLGLPVGEATLTVERERDRYALDLAARLRGLAGFFVEGAGTASAEGRLTRAGPSGTFRVESRYAGKPVRVSMRIERGSARDVVLDPEPTPRPDRVPVTPADRTGIVDPLSMLAVPLDGAALDPGLCARRLPVFDGAARADLVLAPGRLVTVAEGPYRGPALDCPVRWVPIAGHRAAGTNVRRMAENEALSVRLAPALDGAVLLPLAVTVGTAWGTVAIAATQWGTEPEGRRGGVRISLPRAR